MAYLSQEGVKKQIEAKRLKLLRAAKSVMPLLERVLTEKHITIKINSERSASTQFNRMCEVLDELKDIFWLRSDKTLDSPCCRGNHPEQPMRDWLETRFGFPGDLCYEIYTVLNLRKGYRTDYCSVDMFNSFKNCDWYDRENPVQGVSFRNEEYTIQWIPEAVTATSKRNIENEYNEAFQKLVKKMGTLTGECMPVGCRYFRGRNKITECEIAEKLATINKYLNDATFVPRPCSDKQAVYCAKFLNVSEDVAKHLNNFQAREILDIYFNDSYDTDEYKDYINFYLKFLKKFM